MADGDSTAFLYIKPCIIRCLLNTYNYIIFQIKLPTTDDEFQEPLNIKIAFHRCLICHYNQSIIKSVIDQSIYEIANSLHFPLVILRTIF